MAASDTSSIEQSVAIDARAATVWRVFTDPALTRQMGGEYISDWRVGASLQWQGLDGTIYTNGIITSIEPEKLLQHKLIRPSASAAESLITYRLHEQDEQTILLAQEECSSPLTRSEYDDAVEGWKIALQSVKEIAENSSLDH